MFFNRGTCPGGWSEYTDARGRYLVGLTSGGSLGTLVGADLTDKEDRATGYHFHYVQALLGSDDWGWAQATPGQHSRRPLFDLVPDDPFSPEVEITEDSAHNTYGPVFFSPGRAIYGTNAPYVQLLVCEKN
jgi:hypothetical protein